jgi:hypothetical protein
MVTVIVSVLDEDWSESVAVMVNASVTEAEPVSAVVSLSVLSSV